MPDKTDLLASTERRGQVCAVARDVLERLARGRLRLNLGTYFVFLYPFEDLNAVTSRVEDLNAVTSRVEDLNAVTSRGSLAESIDAIEDSCSVCALGACLLSKLKVCDNVGVTSPVNLLHQPAGSRLSPIAIVDQLKSVFTLEQLCLIEMAFEQDDVGIVYSLKHSVLGVHEKDEAIRYCPKGAEMHDRLRMIMENILAHDGVFVPSDRPRKEEIKEGELA